MPGSVPEAPGILAKEYEAVTEKELSDMPDAQLRFVEQIAQYYFDNDGMPPARGRVIGWLIISHPREQSAAEIARRLGVERADVDWVAEKLVPASVLIRRTPDAENPGEYSLEMGDNAWVDRMQQVFSKIPLFHEILAEGVGLLADADLARRRRVVNMERFFGYLASEIPGIFDRYRVTVQTQSA
jgi:hypothetical protein